MEISSGIIFALVAMLCWGFGDFLIQRSTRKIGNLGTLFIIALIGSIILLPFVYKDIPSVFQSKQILFVLIGASIILIIAAFLEFESLKIGKISVIEPIWSLEIPAAALLAFVLLKEKVSYLEMTIIAVLILGLVMISLRSKSFNKKTWFEKGTIFAIIGALLMGFANFFLGWGARLTDAFMINWFINVFITIVCGIYIIKKKRVKKLIKDINKNKKFLGALSLLDNVAWIAFAASMTLAPIAISVAISESYIIIAVLLGLFIGKEKLKKHQKIGLIIAILAALLLSYVAGT